MSDGILTIYPANGEGPSLQFHANEFRLIGSKDDPNVDWYECLDWIDHSELYQTGPGEWLLLSAREYFGSGLDNWTYEWLTPKQAADWCLAKGIAPPDELSSFTAGRVLNRFGNHAVPAPSRDEAPPESAKRASSRHEGDDAYDPIRLGPGVPVKDGPPPFAIAASQRLAPQVGDAASHAQVKVGEWHFDFVRLTATFATVTISLKPMPLKVLYRLAQTPGLPVAREVIEAACDMVGDPNPHLTAIRTALRKQLGLGPDFNPIISCARGNGSAWLLDQEAVAAAVAGRHSTLN